MKLGLMQSDSVFRDYSGFSDIFLRDPDRDSEIARAEERLGKHQVRTTGQLNGSGA